MERERENGIHTHRIEWLIGGYQIEMLGEGYFR